MNKKERMDLLLSKIPETEKKKAFVEELRSSKAKKDTKALLEKYGVVVSEEDLKKLHDGVLEPISDKMLSKVSGGNCGCECDCTYLCSYHNQCNCDCECSYYGNDNCYIYGM